MGGELNQFLSEALAEGGRLGAEAAIRRTDQQRQLGIAIAQNLAGTGQFNSLPPEMQSGFQKLLGKTAFGGLQQLSDINQQLGTIRKGAQAQLQAPVLEETTIQVPTPQVAQQLPDLFGGAPLPQDVTPFQVPPTIEQTAVVERPPTPEEQFQRIKQDAAAAQLIGGTDFSRAVLAEMELKHEQAKLAAKTQLQSDLNARIVDLVGRADSNDSLQGSGVGGMFIRSISANLATGNVNYNLGVTPLEEVRAASVRQANQLIQQALSTGNATPMDVMAGLRAKGDWQGSPADAEQIMSNISQQIIAQATNAGMPIPNVLDLALAQTGTIPNQLDDLLPANIQQAWRLQVAKRNADLTVQTGDLQRKATAVAVQAKVAEAQALKIAENQLQPLTPKEREVKAQSTDTLRKLSDLHARFRDGLTGFVRGSVPTNVLDVFGLLKGGEATFRSEVSTLQSSIIKQITGAQMSESEARRILVAVPALTDRPAVFMAKLELLMHDVSELQRVRDTVNESGRGRWRGDISTKTVEINGMQVEVVELVNGDMADPVYGLDFNSGLEQSAGIAVMRDGTVQSVEGDQATATAGQLSSEAAAAVQAFDDAFAKAFPDAAKR